MAVFVFPIPYPECLWTVRETEVTGAKHMLTRREHANFTQKPPGSAGPIYYTH